MTLAINGIRIDDPANVYVIAELSGNHNNSYSQAEQLVIAAAEAGANAVKVQTFMAAEICADVPILFGHNPTHDAWCARMGVSRMRELFSKGGFPRAWHVPLRKLAESWGVEFLSTPFSVDAARFLVEEIGVNALKIASGDLTFTPLLEYAASTNLPVLLSTGGATMAEVVDAMTIFNHCDSYPIPMHCVSIYPCHDTYANLRAIQTIAERMAWYCGFSDHTLSVDLVPALAVSQGAVVYEKHLRLEEDTISIDAAHSVTPRQFMRMVEVIRRVPQILGTGVKEPHRDEMHDRLFARRDTSDWLRPQMRGRKGAWE